MDFTIALRFFESSNQLLCILVGKTAPLSPAEEMLFHTQSSMSNTIAMVTEGYLQQNVIHRPMGPEGEEEDAEEG